ncbi:MAG: aspartate aminotransferase family protein [Acidobacteria bacterium]|nr:MAG: aspartate aminotransferase family protein [Acidobacteriota bacterium]
MPSSSRDLLTKTAARAVEYLDRVGDRPVKAATTSADLKKVLGGPLSKAGEPADQVIDRLATAAMTGTVATAGPRYFGFVVGGSVPAAVAADWLVSTWDQNAGIYALSPLVSVVEEIAGDWLKSIAGLRSDASVGFVTGCQMANFTALASARHHVLRNAGWDVEARGLSGAPKVTIITSDESHYTIFMALRLLGFGAETPIRIPTDGQGRMRADALANTLAGITGPCIVCAQAGNVNTGAFDPIAEIADIVDAHSGTWLHVDGAFGLWAAASPSRAHLVKGIDRADSVASDAHKWLNVPYDCGLVFTKHPEAHRSAMSLAAAYIQATAVERDPHEFTPEESRRGRAVPVYAALRSLGSNGLGELIERNCRLATRMADRLSKQNGVRILNDVVLNQVLVRFEADGADADQLTRDVIAGVQQEGTCWLGGTTWHRMAAMRVAVSNWSTTDADIDRSADAIISVWLSRSRR